MPIMELAILVGFTAVAGYLLYTGWRELRPAYHILRNDPVSIRELHGYTGPVEIAGTAVTDDESGTVTAPFTGTDCLAYTYEVEELRSSGKNSSWHTLDEGMGGVDFVVEDDSGAVRVDPEGGDVRLEADTLRVSPGDDLPAHLSAYVEATEDVEKQDGTVNVLVTELHVGNEQRFTERRLDIGESVYVYGQSHPDRASEWGSAFVDAAVGDGPDAPVFVISDTGERDTAWRFIRSSVARLAFGIVLLAFSVSIIFQVVGPVPS